VLDVLVVSQETIGEDDSELDESKPETIERLIPWSMHNTVIDVDLKQGVIEVDWDQDFLLD